MKLLHLEWALTSPEISQVIHVGLPAEIELYVHVMWKKGEEWAADSSHFTEKQF